MCYLHGYDGVVSIHNVVHNRFPVAQSLGEPLVQKGVADGCRFPIAVALSRLRVLPPAAPLDRASDAGDAVVLLFYKCRRNEAQVG
jgi:hypothetical protein